MIVENRAGAGGRLAVESLRTPDPAAHAVLITPFHMITMYPHMYKRAPYDPLRELTPVAKIASMPLLLAVGPAVPETVKSVADYLRWSQAGAGRNAFGSPGAGTLNHFVGVLLAKYAGVDLVHVAYKGDAPAVQDLLGGHIPMSMHVPSAILPHLRSGRVRILAMVAEKRSADMPDAPTLAESGFPQIKDTGWFGAFVSGKTPSSTVELLEGKIASALDAQTLQEAFHQQGIRPDFSRSSAFATQIRGESARWAAVVKETGFTLED